MTKFTVNVPFEKLKITEEELAKRQELMLTEQITAKLLLLKPTEM